MVVDYSRGAHTKVFLSMFSHGNWDGKTDTHYFNFPYPSPPFLALLNSVPRPPPPPEPLAAVFASVSVSMSVPSSVDSAVDSAVDGAVDGAALVPAAAGVEVVPAEMAAQEAAPSTSGSESVSVAAVVAVDSHSYISPLTEIEISDPRYRCLQSYPSLDGSPCRPMKVHWNQAKPLAKRKTGDNKH